MAKPARKKKPKVKQMPVKQLTRKELRKQKSQQKKENKRIFFASKLEQKTKVDAVRTPQQQNAKETVKNLKHKKSPGKFVQSPEKIPLEQLLAGDVNSDNDESIGSDFSDEEVDMRMAKITKKTTAQPVKKKAKIQTAPRPDAADLRRREFLRQKDLEQASRKQRIKQLIVENEEEDKMISRLEKKLKLNKTKDKNRLVRKMFNDGLDYALEFCLDDEEEKAKLQLKEKRKIEHQQKQKKEVSWSDEESDDEIFKKVFGSGGEDSASDDDAGEASDDGSDFDDDGDESENEQNNEDVNQFEEDIYGRLRDKEGNIINPITATTSSVSTLPSTLSGPQKYVPPHQRAQLAAAAAASNTGVNFKQTQINERLRRNCKGLLNRLSEANLHKIATGIEELYMKNSRFNMNETLTALLNEALIGPTIANERMVQEHMVLLAYLHAHIGSEIGAHFLQMFIEQFDKFLQEMQTSTANDDKRLNNLVLVLSYLYIFKIYEHRLLLEIIGRLANQLCEKSIECLLLIFQCVGFKLRKDDPLAFKQMMTSVQKKIAEAPLEMKENLRLKFMVDTLNAVKNNNINKIPQFDPTLAEDLRKRLKALLRNDKYVITLNITIDDLLRADQVGKWWIVGSAWTGNINDVGAAAAAKDADKNNSGGKHSQGFSEKLLSLAKKQKMNTDERRSIFCIIMSAEDYVDAFEKILHLALKDQRSIAYVIMHCCMNEKRSNPYYAHLALKFCNYNRKFQLAFQFAMWDRINDIDSLSKQQIRNLAKFLQYLIMHGGLSLAVLKIVDFIQLDKLSFLFMKEIIVGLLLADEDSVIYQAFERVAKNTKLNQFKQSIRLFIQHFLLQEEGDKLKLTDAQMKLLKKRIEYVDNILAYVDL